MAQHYKTNPKVPFKKLTFFCYYTLNINKFVKVLQNKTSSISMCATEASQKRACSSHKATIVEEIPFADLYHIQQWKSVPLW